MLSYVPYSPEWNLQMDLRVTRRERDLFRELLGTTLAAVPERPPQMSEFDWARIQRGRNYKEAR